MNWFEFVELGKSVIEELSGDGMRKRQKEEEREKYQKKLKDRSLTCNKCGGLAEPISGTRRNYRCGCGRQFPGPEHYC